jgi:transcriptional regulator with XRE-family HTH domain
VPDSVPYQWLLQSVPIQHRNVKQFIDNQCFKKTKALDKQNLIVTKTCFCSFFYKFVTYCPTKNPFMTTGAILQAYRDRMKLSQDQVANYLNVKREMLSYWENDSREAPLEMLEKLADLYGADLEDFFEIDVQQVKANIAFAFRADDVSESDLREIAHFRKVVKNYLKLSILEKTV